MPSWTPILISLLALFFAILSFWWMNWRSGKLEVGGICHFAAGKATEGVSDKPNVVIVTLPLILFNGGARPLVVESLRLVEVSGHGIGVLELERIDSNIGIIQPNEVSSSDYFYLPLPLKANEVVKKNFVFQRRTSTFDYGNMLYHMQLEARITANRDWKKVKDIELDFRDPERAPLLGLNAMYLPFPYRTDEGA